MIIHNRSSEHSITAFEYLELLACRLINLFSIAEIQCVSVFLFPDSPSKLTRWISVFLISSGVNPFRKSLWNAKAQSHETFTSQQEDVLMWMPILAFFSLNNVVAELKNIFVLRFLAKSTIKKSYTEFTEYSNTISSICYLKSPTNDQMRSVRYLWLRKTKLSDHKSNSDTIVTLINLSWSNIARTCNDHALT